MNKALQFSDTSSPLACISIHSVLFSVRLVPSLEVIHKYFVQQLDVLVIITHLLLAILYCVATCSAVAPSASARTKLAKLH
jgi:hypothetical protein